MRDSTADSPFTSEFEAMLAERARVLAAPVRDVVGAAERVTHVCFEASGIRFAIATKHVIRIVRDPRTTRIPGAPDRLPRVMYADGRIVSIVDPCMLVGRGAVAVSRKKVLLLEHGARRIGVFADAVASAVSLEDVEIAASPADRDRSPFVVGTTRTLAVMLDASAIVDRIVEGGNR